jgi:hypothetical protein
MEANFLTSMKEFLGTDPLLNFGIAIIAGIIFYLLQLIPWRNIKNKFQLDALKESNAIEKELVGKVKDGADAKEIIIHKDEEKSQSEKRKYDLLLKLALIVLAVFLVTTLLKKPENKNEKAEEKQEMPEKEEKTSTDSQPVKENKHEVKVEKGAVTPTVITSGKKEKSGNPEKVYYSTKHSKDSFYVTVNCESSKLSLAGRLEVRLRIQKRNIYLKSKVNENLEAIFALHKDLFEQNEAYRLDYCLENCHSKYQDFLINAYQRNIKALEGNLTFDLTENPIEARFVFQVPEAEVTLPDGAKLNSRATLIFNTFGTGWCLKGYKRSDDSNRYWFIVPPGVSDRGELVLDNGDGKYYAVSETGITWSGIRKFDFKKP